MTGRDQNTPPGYNPEASKSRAARGRWIPLDEALRHEPSAWLRGVGDTLLRRARSGQLRTCGHPHAALLCLWQPDRLRCGSCARRDCSLTGEADRTCDRCGAVDLEAFSGHVYLTVGVGLVCFGLCGACTEAEGVAS